MLVAFLVLAFGTLAIQHAVMASVDGTRRAGDRLRAERVARSLITAPIPLGPGSMAGSDQASQSGVMEGFAWSIRYEPLRLPFPTGADASGKPVDWVPRRMIVTVRLLPRSRSFLGAGRDPVVNLETIRLVRVSASDSARPEEGPP
ncbi:hypothetical protein LRX75_14530 [Rhizobium sp. DKSPLA3]|uniref:Pilus assembly protein n=1 Tax=Rhizobium quercicola TaxID=2901226 RepID=A0A9X1NVW2_9HYPH|nr:hypothetical protein [Rhizobium quercicola]